MAPVQADSIIGSLYTRWRSSVDWLSRPPRPGWLWKIIYETGAVVRDG